MIISECLLFLFLYFRISVTLPLLFKLKWKAVFTTLFDTYFIASVMTSARTYQIDLQRTRFISQSVHYKFSVCLLEQKLLMQDIKVEFPTCNTVDKLIIQNSLVWISTNQVLLSIFSIHAVLRCVWESI